MEIATLMAIASRPPTTQIFMDLAKAVWSLSRRTCILSLKQNLTSIKIPSKSLELRLYTLKICQQPCPRDLPSFGHLTTPSTDLDGKYVSPEMNLKFQQNFQIA